MNLRCLIICFFISFICEAQYSFSGFIDREEQNKTVYLSLVEDYRKLSGIYSEQIIAKTIADSLGYFEFTGNLLENENRIYRIHVDKCRTDTLDQIDHFNGYCADSEQLLFIANNSDSLNLPFSFGKQIFCKIESSNPKANAFLKIDSLKNDMRFAYNEVRTETNRKLNNKKWFKLLQHFGKSLNEPIAELAIYAYLSDRSNDFYNYYAQDLKTNSYYTDLKDRLDKTYPNTPYSMQYKNELAADRYILFTSRDRHSSRVWSIFLYITLGLSLLLNLFLIYRHWQRKQHETKDLKDKLSKQEQVVLEHLLQDKSNKDIAEALFLSVSTVKSHTNNIYKKLNVQSREDTKSLFNR